MERSPSKMRPRIYSRLQLLTFILPRKYPRISKLRFKLQSNIRFMCGMKKIKLKIQMRFNNLKPKFKTRSMKIPKANHPPKAKTSQA